MKSQYGGLAAERKLALLQRLENRRLARAPEVLRFHEVLCFLRGYPDNPVVLSQVERLLADFDGRADLRRHRRALINSGIAGTAIHFSFFWFTARWLARRWPERLSIEWAQFRNKGKLVGILPLLVPYSETPALDELTLSAREWVRRFKGPGESDAVFLVRRFQGLRAGSFELEKFYEDLQIPIRLAPGPDTPSRTRARYPTQPVVFQRRALSSERPDLHRELRRPPLAVRPLPPREAQKLIDLAREAMVTRSRDLDVFEHADRDDVRLVDAGDGLQFACIGVLPERRLVLEAVYGFLTLKNGVPIGYALASALFGSSEVMYNVFDTYRGGESASTYGRLLAIAAPVRLGQLHHRPVPVGHRQPGGAGERGLVVLLQARFSPARPGGAPRAAGGAGTAAREPPAPLQPGYTQEVGGEEYVFLSAWAAERHSGWVLSGKRGAANCSPQRGVLRG
jgi:hypothetical protein